MSTATRVPAVSALGFNREEWADRVAKQIRALRNLTATSGTRTTKTQNDILQSLPNDVLAAVALKLDEAQSK